MRSGAVPIIIVALAAVLGAGCAPRAPDRVQGAAVQATPEEQHLLTYLQRDQFIRVTDLIRDDQGHLVVTTRQGDTWARYLIAPADEASRTLTLRRITDEQMLLVSPSDELGTGAPPRGLVD